MFKLIALALHFGSYYQGPIDPVVVEMLREEADRRDRKSQSRAENVVAIKTTQSEPETRKAA